MKALPQKPALLVRNYGPVRDGYRDNGGFMFFPRVTVFCGPQGSGKSTVAKLYSTCSWIEKNAFRNKGLTKKPPLDTASFRKFVAWQGLADCFRNETEIVFFGQYLSFRFFNGRVSDLFIDEKAEYQVPKIMYMPAERNIASVVREAPGIKTLPQPLQELIVEFETAKQRLSFLRLPVNGFSYRFDRKKGESWIVNGRGADSSQTHLELASSGLQSMVPLLIVAESIAHEIRLGSWKTAGFGRSPSEVLQFRRRIEQLVAESTDDAAGPGADILRFLSPNVRFVNIVEEPEQNLFPPAQDAVMNRLLEVVGEIAGNQLVVSTHSPYLVNHLVLSAKAAELYRRTPETSTSLVRKLGRIVPRTCAIDIGDMALYETEEDGSISRVPVSHGTFDDSNALNTALGSWNRKFEKLLDAEDEIANAN